MKLSTVNFRNSSGQSSNVTLNKSIVRLFKFCNPLKVAQPQTKMGVLFSKILTDDHIKLLHGLQRPKSKWDLRTKDRSYGTNCRNGIWSRKMHRWSTVKGTQGQSDVSDGQSSTSEPIEEIDHEAAVRAIYNDFFPSKDNIHGPKGDSSAAIMKLCGIAEETEEGLENVEKDLSEENYFNRDSSTDGLDVNGNVLPKPHRKSVICLLPVPSDDQSNTKGSRVHVLDDGSLVTIPTPEEAESRKSKSCRRIVDNVTTNLVGRFRPNVNGTDVEVEYHFNRETKKDSFQSSKPIVELTRELGGKDPGDVENVEMTCFFQNLELIVNKAYGELQWNDITVVAEGDPENRLKLSEYELEPSKLFFAVNGLAELHILRSSKQLALKGATNEGVTKWFRMKGPKVSTVGIENAYNGMVCLSFPEPDV